MKKRLLTLILSIALLVTPASVYADDVDVNIQSEEISIVSKTNTFENEDKDLKLREEIKAAIERNKSKLAGLEYLKKKMPNSFKRYQKTLEKAETEARRAIKRAEEFLYGKEYKDNISRPIEESVDKSKENKGNNSGNWTGGFRDPNSPAYLQANGRIIGNVKSYIYHVPSGRFYKKVSIENAVFFKTEKEARDAGYRRSKR